MVQVSLCNYKEKMKGFCILFSSKYYTRDLLPLVVFFCFPFLDVVSPIDGHLSFSAFTVMSQGKRKLLPCKNPGKSNPENWA